MTGESAEYALLVALLEERTDDHHFESPEMKRKFIRILGISLIIFTWIIWGVIFILPFFKLTLTQYAIAYPVLLAATNIFWVGAALVGKELIQKYNLISRAKKLLKKFRGKKEE